MEKKKILIFSTAYLPFVGGAEIAIKEITDRLGEDFEFEMITARLGAGAPSREQVGNILVHRIGLGHPTIDKLWLPFGGALKIFSLKKKTDFFAFWCVMASFASGSAYIFNLISRKKVPIILTLQEGDSEGHFASRWGGMINISWRLALGRTKIVTAISSFLADRAKRFGFAGDVLVVPNGVDLEKFTPADRKFILDYVMIITTSRLVHKNGIDTLIESLRFLPADYRLFIIGDGPDRDELENLAFRYALTDRVDFIGTLNHDEMIKYLRQADVFVRPSRTEGLGNSFLEAMALGLPTIGTPVGGIVDFMTDNETGWLVPLENPEALAEKIKSVHENRFSTDRVAKNGQELVRKNYNWDDISKQMGEIFFSVKNL